MGAERALVRGTLQRPRATALKGCWQSTPWVHLYFQWVAGVCLVLGLCPLLTQARGPARLHHDLCKCLPSLIAAAALGELCGPAGRLQKMVLAPAEWLAVMSPYCHLPGGQEQGKLL